MLLREVRPWGGPVADVVLRDGVIAEVRPHQSGSAGSSQRSAVDTVDGAGRLLVPALVDAHIHLDSNRLGLPFRGHTAGTAELPASLAQLIGNDRAHWREDPPVAERAGNAIGLALARGCTRFRSYAQVDTDCRLERLEGVLAAAQQYAGRAEVTVIAFPQAGVITDPGVADLLAAALQAGAGVIGGIDPCGLDRDPAGQLDVVFGLAQRYQVPVDIHLHERGTLGAFSMELIAERTRALGMAGQVTISHAFALGSSNDDTTVGALVELLADNDIAVATVAPSGSSTLPLRRLTEAGIRVGLGQDGMRDYWSPYGNADLLDRTWQLAFTQNYRADALVEHALAVASIGGRSVLDPRAPRLAGVHDRPGLAPGDPADLLVLEGDSVTAAVMDRTGDRTVLHRGRVVADGLALVGRRYRTGR